MKGSHFRVGLCNGSTAALASYRYIAVLQMASLAHTLWTLELQIESYFIALQMNKDGCLAGLLV